MRVTPRESELLENALDALDRLHDWHCGAFDVWALFVATAAALHDTPHRPALEQPLAALHAVIGSRAAEELQRDRALGITDSLRQYLAEVLAWRPALLPGGGSAEPGAAADGGGR